MRSVNATLTANYLKVRAGTAPQQIGIKFAQDVAIWFANEVIESRATLEANIVPHDKGG